MSDHWWVVDAPAHRAVERKMMPETMMFAGEEVPVIGMCPPDDEWVCDFCNAGIETRRTVEVGDEEMTLPVMVPMVGSNALCLRCAMKHGFPSRWDLPPIVCACDGCEAAVRAGLPSVNS